MANTQRINALLLTSLAETLQVFSDCQQFPKTIHLIVGLPNDRPGLEKDLEKIVENSLKEFRHSNDLSLPVEFVRRDHGSGLIGLQKAKTICQENREAFVLVACADSFVSKETIDWLERSNQLYCSSNKNGFTPGEASACCLVCTDEMAQKYRLPIRAKLLEVSYKLEAAKMNDTLVNAGKGLSEAIGAVLEPLPEGESVQEVLCTLKGIREEASEYGLSNMAMGKYMKKPGEYLSLCPCWGDIGVASATALLACVAELPSKGYWNSRSPAIV
jgi:hypothetical protein